MHGELLRKSMKIKDLTLIVLLVLCTGGYFFYNARINHLESQLAKAAGHVDTLKVTLQMHDTLFVSVADTVLQQSDTTVIGDTTVINHWPMLVDNVSQPLFDLRVQVDTKKSKFDYNFRYKPLALYMQFTDKYDLRKGFKVSTVPDIGTINVDWGNYKPLKKGWGVTGAVGVGYSRAGGVCLLGELSIKGIAAGVLLQENSTGVYVKKSLFSF
jgi:hypothetical protein